MLSAEQYLEIAKYTKEIKELNTDVNDLKCCANCKDGRQHPMECCGKGRTVLQDEVCDEWQTDNAKYENRRIDI